MSPLSFSFIFFKTHIPGDVHLFRQSLEKKMNVSFYFFECPLFLLPEQSNGHALIPHP